MIKLVMLVRRKQGMDVQAFRDHYENVHAPLAQSLFPSLRAYVRNYPESALAGEAPAFDAITELWFDDEAGWQESIAVAQSEQGKLLQADEESFMDRATVTAMLVKEHISEITSL